MIQSAINSISPSALADLLDAGHSPLFLLDVRTPPEFAAAHLPGAISIPLGELKPEAFRATHTPGKPIYVLCQSGGRASKAIEQLQAAGCTDAVLVEGGTQAWIDAGLPVHRGASKVLPLMRQVQIVVGSLALLGSILALTVDRWFALLPLVVGCGLLFAGLSGACGMAMVLAKMPWNRTPQHPPRCSCA